MILSNLSKAFSNVSNSVGSAAQQAAQVVTPPAPPTLLKSAAIPVPTLNPASVLRGGMLGGLASALQWFNPVEKTGIIIVGGKTPGATNPAADRGIIIVSGKGGGTDPVVNGIRNQLDGAMKGLESQDKLGNFEIQDLMSQYNQAETVASNVHRKRNDAVNDLIGKI